MIETFLDLLQLSSAIFGIVIFRNVWKMFRNTRLVFGTILENREKSSESGQQSSEYLQKRHH